jgi:hypothetical protein
MRKPLAGSALPAIGLRVMTMREYILTTYDLLIILLESLVLLVVFTLVVFYDEIVAFISR